MQKIIKRGEDIELPFGLFYGNFIPRGITHSTLHHTAKLLYGQLLHYSGKNGKAFPSRVRLADDLCWTPKMVDRAIRILKDANLLRTYQTDPRSPSTYILIYNPDYLYDCLKEKFKGGFDKNVKGGFDAGGKHKENNNERVKKFFLSKKCKTFKISKSQVKAEAFTSSQGLDRCNGSSCNEVINNLVNDTIIKPCKFPKITKPLPCNTITEDTSKKINGNNSLPKMLPKIQIKPNPFGYSKNTMDILNHWQKCGGKVHQQVHRRKVSDQIDLEITQLLMSGLNPYVSVIDDDSYDLKIKKWTVKEIIACIDHYTKVNKKSIEGWYFDKFITFRNHYAKSKRVRNLPDFSPLVESYQNLPQQISHYAKKLKIAFTGIFPNMHFYDKAFINIADYFEPLEDVYKKEDIVHGDLSSMFLAYMKEKVSIEGTYNCLQYMSAIENLKEFIRIKERNRKIVKRTKDELQEYLFEKPIRLKNKFKALQQKKELDGGMENWGHLLVEEFKHLELAVC